MAIDPSIPLQAQAPPRPSPAEIMGQVLAIQRANQQKQLVDVELTEKRRAMAAEDALNNAMTRALKPDGSIDLDLFGQAVAGTPAAGKFIGVAKSIGEMQEQQGKVLKARQEAAEAEADYVGSLATGASTYEDPEDQAAVLVAGIGRAVKLGLMSKDEAMPWVNALLDDNGQPDRTNVGQVIRQLQAQSGKQRKMFSDEETSGAAASNAAMNRAESAAQLPGITADSAIKAAQAAGMVGGLTPDQLRQKAQAEATLELNKQKEAREAAIAYANLALNKQKEAREAAAAKATGGGKLAAAAIEKIAGIDQSLTISNSLERLVKDDWLGPVAGRIASAKIATPGVPISDDLARFAADSATLKNSVIKAITGAQMSEPEAVRIGKQIPDLIDKPNVWRAKLKATKVNLEMLKRRTIELSGGTYEEGGAAPAAPKTRIYYDANGNPK